VQVYEVGWADGCSYLALEHVDGGSLARRLSGTPLPARQAARLVEVLARAMHEAHQKGVVHRDRTAKAERERTHRLLAAELQRVRNGRLTRQQW
jgi:hypothetical protein